MITVLIIIICLLGGIGLYGLITYTIESNKPFIVKNIEKYDEFDSKVYIDWGGDEYIVVGDCTVWNYYPSGKRCDTFMEGKIVDAIKAYRFKQDEDTKKL